MKNHKDRLRRLKLGLPLNEKTFIYADAALNSSNHSLAQWLAEEFNRNFDEYDKAIDAVYNSTYVGGSSYHHFLDGQHSILGAIRAVKDVKSDDTFVQEIMEAGEHLLRDTASVSGINPLFSLTSEQFDTLANLCQNIGISRPFLADALTFNSPELLGGIIGLTASLVLAKKQDPTRLSDLSGAYLVSALSSANPILLPIAAGGLVYSIRKSEDKKVPFIKAGKGSIVSGSAILVSGLIGGPVWLGCVTAVTTAIAVRYSLDNPQKAFEKAKGFIRPANSVIRKISLAIE